MRSAQVEKRRDQHVAVVQRRRTCRRRGRHGVRISHGRNEPALLGAWKLGPPSGRRRRVRRDGTELYVRPIPNPALLLVDFETGEDRRSLAHEVEARVVPGSALGHAEETCLVVLTVFRRAAAADAGWEQAWHMFQTEIQMIKGRLERGFR